MKNENLYGTCLCLDIYDDHINVLWGDIEKAKTITDVDYRENVDGWVVNNDGIIYAYLGKNLRDKSLICHELTHAILELTYKRGILLDDEAGNQEHLAYLFGYVMGQVLSMKKKDWYIWKGTKKFECNFKK